MDAGENRNFVCTTYCGFGTHNNGQTHTYMYARAHTHTHTRIDREIMKGKETRESEETYDERYMMRERERGRKFDL